MKECARRLNIAYKLSNQVEGIFTHIIEDDNHSITVCAEVKGLGKIAMTNKIDPMTRMLHGISGVQPRIRGHYAMTWCQYHEHEEMLQRLKA